MSPDDPAALSDYVARHGPDVMVNIEFATRREVTGDWVIVPADGSRTFRLRFALPAVLADWLFRDDGAAVLRARDVKADVLSSIAVFLDGRLVRLLFSLPPDAEADTAAARVTRRPSPLPPVDMPTHPPTNEELRCWL